MSFDLKNGPPVQPRLVRDAIGESEAFQTFQQRISQAAQVDRPVLIVGERGTGKELAAARLHNLSARWGHPLVTLNCAALSPTLIESELFGYEAGAFTGAARRRAGRFETADRGTLFLDEIGHIPMEVQIKILRVVEYQMFERVGGSVPIEVDVRIVGATNADLPALAEQGRFQKDLLDRLSFEVLRVPPLRERLGDLPTLANYFAARMAHELGRGHVPLFTEEAMAALEAYPWPGNIRELKNVVERAVYRTEYDLIEEVVFDPFPRFDVVDPPKKVFTNKVPELPDSEPANDLDPDLSLDIPMKTQMENLEKALLQKALEESKFNQRAAARRLGLSYNQFRGLYRKYKEDAPVDG